MYVSSVLRTSELYFDMVRTTTRKTIVNDTGEKVKELVETTYRPYNHIGQLDSTAQTKQIVDIRA